MCNSRTHIPTCSSVGKCFKHQLDYYCISPFVLRPTPLAVSYTFCKYIINLMLCISTNYCIAKSFCSPPQDSLISRPLCSHTQEPGNEATPKRDKYPLLVLNWSNFCHSGLFPKTIGVLTPKILYFVLPSQGVCSLKSRSLFLWSMHNVIMVMATCPHELKRRS